MTVEDLGETMRAISSEPPPTTIDIDQVIAKERRRERHLRVVVGASVMVLALALGTALLPGLRFGGADADVGMGSDPSGTASAPRDGAPSATPAETASPDPDQSPTALACGEDQVDDDGERESSPAKPATSDQLDTVRQLTSTFRKNLIQLLPEGADVVDAARVPGCATWGFVYHLRQHQYVLDLEISDDFGTGTLTVIVMPWADEWNDDCDRDRTCSQVKMPDGTVYTTRLVTDGDEFTRSSVNVRRADDVVVLLRTTNRSRAAARAGTNSRQGLTLDVDQLVTLGRSPGSKMIG